MQRSQGGEVQGFPPVWAFGSLHGPLRPSCPFGKMRWTLWGDQQAHCSLTPLHLQNKQSFQRCLLRVTVYVSNQLAAVVTAPNESCKPWMALRGQLSALTRGCPLDSSAGPREPTALMWESGWGRGGGAGKGLADGWCALQSPRGGKGDGGVGGLVDQEPPTPHTV